MQTFAGRTALITGAAGGIGLALARKAAAEGMRLVLGDIDGPALDAAAEALREEGAEVVTRVADVRDPEAHAALDTAAREAFGAVHLLVENAGIGSAGSVLGGDLADWKASLDINLYGVLHGLRASVPGMIAHGEPAHVVTVASLAGVTVNAGMGPYTVAKHGVVTLTETLRDELKLGGHAERVGTSVFCPAWIKTNIAGAVKTRLEGDGVERAPDPMRDAVSKFVQSAVSEGMAPADAADAVFDAVRARRFWIFTHAESGPAIRRRMARMLADAPDPQPEPEPAD